MFENIVNFFKKLKKTDKNVDSKSKETAKERLHLVLMQDRANVSADFLDMMKQEIIEVIKKYIDIDEKAIDVKLTNKMNDDGTVGAPALYANIPIVTIKNDARKISSEDKETTSNIEHEENTKDNTNTEKSEKSVEEKDEEHTETKVEETKDNADNAEDSTSNIDEEKEDNNQVVVQNEDTEKTVDNVSDTDKEKANK